MKIKKISIKNFRLFTSNAEFTVDEINIPNDSDEGSGITVFIGENGCGKSSLLEAIALPLLNYKAESFHINDFNNPGDKTFIQLFSENNFSVDITMPRGSFFAKGFQFEAGVRERGNRAFLSSIVVSDQKFIKADGQDKPRDGSPDLRVNVNNPFKGQRFHENEVIFLDKNRTFQTRAGTYNPTRFDRLMEDFDFQNIKGQEEIPDLNEDIDLKVSTDIENDFLTLAIEKFKSISKIELSLNYLDNWKPFSKAFFAERKNNQQLINLNMHGSGFEMIFALIYPYYLSLQSGKQLIILIDEPELHLHPELQGELVEFLLEISKTVQIILTSQSPLFVKQLLKNQKVKVYVLQTTDDDTPELVTMDRGVLPYVSANEVNYLGFNLATEEYHNELYGHIQEVKHYTINATDNHLEQRGITKTKNWIKLTNGVPEPAIPVTLPTYVRHSIHHPENTHNQRFTHEELAQSIELLKSLWPL